MRPDVVAAPRSAAGLGRRPDGTALVRLLSAMPWPASLTTGDDLLILYERRRTAEAAALDVAASQAGMTAWRTPVGSGPDAMARQLAQACGGGRRIAVISDLPLALPPAAIQLAGTPDRSPAEFWDESAGADSAGQPRAVGAEVAAFASSLPAEMELRTDDGAVLTITAAEPGWTADLGWRSGGLARAVPAGSVVTSLASCRGTFVASAAIAVNRPVTWDARLAGPVRVSVADGHVTGVECADARLSGFVERAVRLHRAGRCAALRIGLRELPGGFCGTPGPVNSCQRGLTLVLDVAPDRAYSPASADLSIALTAAWPADQLPVPGGGSWPAAPDCQRSIELDGDI